jgi:hypothetical protein
MIRDRDGIYGEAFYRRLDGIGVKEVLTAPQSPLQNPYAERHRIDPSRMSGSRHRPGRMSATRSASSSPTSPTTTARELTSRLARTLPSQGPPSRPAWAKSSSCSRSAASTIATSVARPDHRLWSPSLALWVVVCPEPLRCLSFHLERAFVAGAIGHRRHSPGAVWPSSGGRTTTWRRTVALTRERSCATIFAQDGTLPHSNARWIGCVLPSPPHGVNLVCPSHCGCVVPFHLLGKRGSGHARLVRHLEGELLVRCRR